MIYPKISVVTVCYNAVDTIEKTILSVINQTYPNVEYIIVDGASIDGTIEVVCRYRDKIAKFITEPDKGIYDAMNKGVIYATGEWIHFLNAGDVYHTDTVIANFIPQINNSTQIAYGDTQYVFSIASKVKKPISLMKMDKQMPFGHPATFVKTAYHKKHLFDSSYKSSGDFKFFYSAYFNDDVNFQYIPIVVADFEAEKGISTMNASQRELEDARILGKDKSIIWLFSHFCITIIRRIKKVIKYYLPKDFVKKIEYHRKKTLISRL